MTTPVSQALTERLPATETDEFIEAVNTGAGDAAQVRAWLGLERGRGTDSTVRPEDRVAALRAIFDQVQNYDSLEYLGNGVSTALRTEAQRFDPDLATQLDNWNEIGRAHLQAFELGDSTNYEDLDEWHTAGQRGEARLDAAVDHVKDDPRALPLIERQLNDGYGASPFMQLYDLEYLREAASEIETQLSDLLPDEDPEVTQGLLERLDARLTAASQLFPDLRWVSEYRDEFFAAGVSPTKTPSTVGGPSTVVPIDDTLRVLTFVDGEPVTQPISPDQLATLAATVAAAATPTPSTLEVPVSQPASPDKQHRTQRADQRGPTNGIRVTISGNVAAEPTFGFTDAGRPWARLRVASNEHTRQADGSWKVHPPEYSEVVLFGAAAEKATNSLAVGDAVLVKGRPEVETFTRNDGTTGAAMKVFASSVTPRSLPETDAAEKSVTVAADRAATPTLHHTPAHTVAVGVQRDDVDVRAALKDAGFKWSAPRSAWYLPAAMDYPARTVIVDALPGTDNGGRSLEVSDRPAPGMAEVSNTPVETTSGFDSAAPMTDRGADLSI